MHRWFKYIVSVIFLVLIVQHIQGQSFGLDKGFKYISELKDVNGVSVADYDLDGDLDIFIVSVHQYQEGNRQTYSRLLQNNGINGFSDVTSESNLLYHNTTLRNGWMGDRMSASWGDYDNDGYPDLFLANDGGDELWHNEGNFQFKNVTATSGVEGCYDCYSSNGLWWDYDLDGDLDLYVSDWLKENRLYRNNGGGNFSDESISSGLNDSGKTWSAMPIDINKDVFLDLYVVNDFGANILFLNNGLGEFYNATEEYGLENEGDGMGVDVCDYNNDGNFDIYVTNIYNDLPNPFFVGSDNGLFMDTANELGIDNTGWGWGARFLDVDNDKDEDLYVVNGMNLSAGRGDRNFFFKNEDGQFIDISVSLGVNNEAQGRGLEVFDYDRDGDMDMLVGNREDDLSLYQNLLMESMDNGNNWIQIILEGSESNKNGFGSVVEINCNGEYYYHLYSGVNLFGQSIKPIHFGLANHTVIDEVAVTWPNGVKEYFPSVEANQFIKLKEGEASVQSAFKILSTSEDNTETGINIFPNPLRDKVSITFSENNFGQVNFKLINSLGQVVYNEVQNCENCNKIEFEISNTKVLSGIYTYQLEMKGRVKVGKVLKK